MQYTEHSPSSSRKFVGTCACCIWKECDSEDWLSFLNVENLMLDGSGKIDGQGAAWWSTSQYDGRLRKLLGDNDCKPQKALQFQNSQNLKVSGLTFLNNPQVHIGINSCDNTDVSHLNIHAPEDSPNTDGIDTSFSSHVMELGMSLFSYLPLIVK